MCHSTMGKRLLESLVQLLRPRWAHLAVIFVGGSLGVLWGSFIWHLMGQLVAEACQ